MVAGSTPSPGYGVPIMTASSKPTDGSGTATTTAGYLFGGVIPPNGFEVQNIDATNSLAISEGVLVVFGAPGTNTVIPGASYSPPISRKPGGPISIIAAASTAKFTARFW